MSFDISLIPDGGAAWLDASGANSDIVISTRVRLARNVEGYAFTGRAREGERLRVLAQVRDAIGRIPALSNRTGSSMTIRVDELGSSDRALLYERHLISKDLKGPGAALHIAGSASVMVNEEDHLRLQAMQSGFSIPQVFEQISDIDRDLGQQLPYAFHPEFGFVTACPTNVGTGLRASVLIHLPGLVLTKEIGKVLNGLQQMGLTYRGLYGEGSEVVGNFFQISNQTTLGRSENDLIDHLAGVVRLLIEKEEEARKVLVRDAGYILEDKLWRAYGTLRYARSLSFEEAMNLLSGVRLAVGLKLIDNLSVYTLNKLLVFSQPAHLAYVEGKKLDEDETSIARARFVRKTLE